MNRDRCVRNDIDMVKRPFFIIVTGANMAGKSTYLRTVGINYLLACIGAPRLCPPNGNMPGPAHHQPAHLGFTE